MHTSKTVVKKLSFPPGEKVHYGNSDTWLTLCGDAWIHCSNYPPDVTCIECLSILEQIEQKEMSDD